MIVRLKVDCGVYGKDFGRVVKKQQLCFGTIFRHLIKLPIERFMFQVTLIASILSVGMQVT